MAAEPAARALMEIAYYHLSTAGPVRPKNEDYVGFYNPPDAERRRTHGAVLILADGVGGQGDGDVASRIAVNTALETFTSAKPDTSPNTLLWQMFNAANIAIYDANMDGKSKMATTLTISVFRNNTVNIGHVGDCRAYLISRGRIRRITNDHSYAGVQVKLGLITVDEAASSELRTVLTRTVGQDPTIRIDYHSLTVAPGDMILHASDGLYCCMSEKEIYDIASRWPELACQELHGLAERRGADDNLSVQLVQIKEVERVGYYRGQAVYTKVPDITKGLMAQELQVGQLLDDRFAITDIISRSGMATIYKATDLTTDRPVALKVPFMHFESDPGFFTRFQREEEIGTSLSHPYILRVEKLENKSRPYLIMEYLEGQTLGHLMKSVKPLPVSDGLKIASRVCEALHYLHTHDVVHRDLKPDNIMICNDGSIRIMDFGIAKVEGSRRLTFGGFQPAMGTPDYMAPEQVRGKRGDARTDIYSLGAILYEMVTGHPPFEGATPLVIMNARLTGDPIAPRRRNPEANISPQVEEIILKAMARNPAERYPNAREFKNDLDHPEQVKVTGLAERLQRPSPLKSRLSRHRVTLLAIAIPVLLFLIFFLATHVKITFK